MTTASPCEIDWSDNYVAWGGLTSGQKMQLLALARDKSNDLFLVLSDGEDVPLNERKNVGFFKGHIYRVRPGKRVTKFYQHYPCGPWSLQPDPEQPVYRVITVEEVKTKIELQINSYPLG